jgi:hypothetical protein
LFVQAGTLPVNRVAMWDGRRWNALGSGVDDRVEDLVLDSRDNLYAGGYFVQAGDKPSLYIARWSRQQSYLPLVLRGSP